jgi:hypothetical protein
MKSQAAAAASSLSCPVERAVDVLLLVVFEIGEVQFGVFLVGTDKPEQHMPVPLFHFVPRMFHIHCQSVVVILVRLPVLNIDLQFHLVALLDFEVLHVDLLFADTLRHEFVVAVLEVDGDVGAEGGRQLREDDGELEVVFGGYLVAAFVGLFEFELLSQNYHVEEVYFLDLKEGEDVSEEFVV